MNVIHVWLLLAGITFIMELGHPGLFLFLAISIGSFSTAGIAAVVDSSAVQLVGFISMSVLSFSLLQRYTAKQKTVYASNAHALIGAHGIVTEKITAYTPGRVRIRSEEWIARSVNHMQLEVGSSVQVIRIDRTTVIVSPYHHP